MSRLYGGIHYRQGNVAGLKNGDQIGTYVCQQLQLKKTEKNNQ
jgi:hypothetical protein